MQKSLTDTLYDLVNPGTSDTRDQRDAACTIDPKKGAVSDECQGLNNLYSAAKKTAVRRLLIISGVGGLGVLYGVVRVLRGR